jgi:hypothetical protein
VRVGDFALSADETTGTVGWKRIENVVGRTHDRSLRLFLRQPGGGIEEIKTTLEHMFWVEGRGWTEAGRIGVSDKIRTLKEWANVERVVVVAGAVNTLDLTVDRFHTFYVGESRAWAHNCNSVVYQLVDEFGDPVYYGKTRTSELANTVRRHENLPPGPWSGLQVISGEVAEHQALNLETHLIQSAKAEGRTIYNVAPRSISEARAEGIALPRTQKPTHSILNQRIRGGRD